MDALGKDTFMTSMKEQKKVLYYKVRFLIYLLTFSNTFNSARDNSAREVCCNMLTIAFFAHLSADTRTSERDIRYYLHTYGR